MALNQKSLEFLLMNKMNDSKAWYEEHKADYVEFVKQPFSEFIEKMRPAINEIDDTLVVNPKKMSRLYRDVRFSRDKSLFRDTVWCMFGHGKELFEGLPGYFFEFSPYGFRYGCGYYQASKESMTVLRELIMNRDKSATAALKAYENQNVFTLEGENYKKSHYPEYSAAERAWLDKKTVCLIASSEDFDVLFSEGLADKVSVDYKLIAPIYHFLMKVELIAAERRNP